MKAHSATAVAHSSNFSTVQNVCPEIRGMQTPESTWVHTRRLRYESQVEAPCVTTGWPFAPGAVPAIHLNLPAALRSARSMHPG
eukprot:5301864-Prymnesium_polylepis.4